MKLDYPQNIYRKKVGFSLTLTFLVEVLAAIYDHSAVNVSVPLTSMSQPINVPAIQRLPCKSLHPIKETDESKFTVSGAGMVKQPGVLITKSRVMEAIRRSIEGLMKGEPQREQPEKTKSTER